MVENNPWGDYLSICWKMKLAGEKNKPKELSNLGVGLRGLINHDISGTECYNHCYQNSTW